MGEFWWTKNGKVLMLVISKTNEKILTKQIFPLTHKDGNRYIHKYPLAGKYPDSGIDKFDLYQKETDRRKILKVYLGVKEDK